MLLRKLNAGLSLLTTLLILDHAMFFSAWLLSAGTMEKSSESMPRILTMLMLVHAALSIVILIRDRRRGEKKGNAYPGLNAATWVQRISGILMLPLLGIHVAGAVHDFQPPLLHALCHPVFFGVVLSHVAVSPGKALITLGVGSAGFIRVVDVAMRLLCGITFAAGAAGLYIYLFQGVA